MNTEYTYIWMHFIDKGPELRKCTPKGYASRIGLDGWSAPTQQEIDDYADPVYALAYD